MCEKQSYCHFSKAQNNFVTAKRLWEVILKLTPIVEGKSVKEELKNAGRGAIMHDGWTLSAGVHYNN